MSEQTKLKACPVCGKKAYAHQEHIVTPQKVKIGKWGVHCGTVDCIILPYRHETREQAIKAWNTRSLVAIDEGELSNLLFECLKIGMSIKWQVRAIAQRFGTRPIDESIVDKFKEKFEEKGKFSQEDWYYSVLRFLRQYTKKGGE